MYNISKECIYVNQQRFILINLTESICMYICINDRTKLRKNKFDHHNAYITTTTTTTFISLVLQSLIHLSIYLSIYK